MVKFSKIEGGFPEPNSLNKFGNEYDYDSFNSLQMTITVCQVPWDLGEVHVGLKQIDGLGNVIGWDSEEQRDKWFADKEDKIVFETQFRKFHSKDEIILPLPFYALTDYNYICVEHEEFPTEYGKQPDSIRKFFYFVRDMEMLSPNSTRVSIMRDDWTTYICRLKIMQASMIQGHYAIKNTSVDKYLSNPVANNTYLLGGEQSEMIRGRVASSEGVIFNDEVVAAFIFSTNPYNSATRNNVGSQHTVGSEPAGYVVGVDIEDYGAFTNAIPSHVFKSVQGVVILPTKFVTLPETQTDLFGIKTWNIVTLGHKSFNIISLNKDMFGYPDKYKELAKLYTYPYASLEIGTNEGEVLQVRIEDTTGNIQLQGYLREIMTSPVFNGHLLGLGSGHGSITWKNLNEQNIRIGGKWFNSLFNWSIPHYALIQSPYDANEVSTRGARNTLTDTTAENNSASSDNTSTQNSADSANTTTRNNANTANTSTQNSANSAITAANNAKVASDVSEDNAHIRFEVVSNNSMIDISTYTSIEADQAQASIGGITTMIAGAEAASNVVGIHNIAGDLAHAVANISNAVAYGSASPGLTISAASSRVMSNAQQSNNRTLGDSTTEMNTNKAKSTRDLNSNVTGIGNSAASNITNRNNTANSSITSQNNSARKAVTDRNNTANTRNAKTTNDNTLLQGGLDAPPMYGSYANRDYVEGIWANVCTISDSELRSVGDTFLRFGYPMNGEYVDFDTFNIMKKFTFWKCADIILEPSGLPDVALDGIRYLLMGGVTVWNNPEDIGYTSIYDN